MTPLVVIVTLEVDPGDAPAMKALASTMAAATRDEPGCLHYAFGEDIDRPGCFHLSERWIDAAALDAHFASPHMATYRAGVRALRIVRRSAMAYEVSGEKPL
jgi:quinol monooxygenase YgiN